MRVIRSTRSRTSGSWCRLGCFGRMSLFPSPPGPTTNARCVDARCLLLSLSLLCLSLLLLLPLPLLMMIDHIHTASSAAGIALRFVGVRVCNTTKGFVFNLEHVNSELPHSITLAKRLGILRVLARDDLHCFPNQIRCSQRLTR